MTAINESKRKSIEALGEFHDALLPATIKNALETSFYRERWNECNVDNINLTSLENLPTIDKEEIRAAGSSAQNRKGFVCNDILTSGTTANPLITARSDREQQFIKEFFTQQLRERPMGQYYRGLEFTNPYHGHLVSIPTSIHYHRVSVYDAGSFDYGRDTLTKTHNDSHVEDRCSVLTGLERNLRAFTYDTISKFPDGFPKTALRLVVSCSQLLTASWRSRYEDTWGAPVVDRFGISEVFGGASQCLNCGWYHFDHFVVPEVVSAHNGEIILEGKGLLALTALYPFQQAQPLVRYLTGDLVEVTKTDSCRPGTVSIKPLGRAKYGVPNPNSDQWFITPASILESVDEIKEIKRIPRFSGVDQVSDPYAIGHPKYRTRWRRKPSKIEVEIEFALPMDIPERRRTRIETNVAREIIRRNDNLQQAVKDRRISIKVDSCDDVDADLIAQAHSGGVWSEM